jgi:hypothetical protein
MIAFLLSANTPSLASDDSPQPPEITSDFDLTGASVRYLEDLNVLVFEQRVVGRAGATTPKPAGQMQGAPVLAYVFPTTLSADQVGFAETEGVLALAVTSHPDFDDTPLWDENNDRDNDNDGIVYHAHWVVLVPDQRIGGALAVKETPTGISDEERSKLLPRTSPGMPIYLDSPGFSIRTDGNMLRVVVPSGRILGDRSITTGFKYDAVTAYLEVNLDDKTRPTLGVYEVYDVLSGDLSLPYSVELSGIEPDTEPGR